MLTVIPTKAKVCMKNPLSYIRKTTLPPDKLSKF